MEQNSATNINDPKHERVIEFESKEVRELVEKKLELVTEGRKLNDEALEVAQKHQELVEKITDIAGEIRDIQHKIIPMMKDICEEQNLLEEYEVPMTTDLKDGKLILRVEDQMQHFIDRFNSSDKFGEVPEIKDAKAEIKE